MSEAMRTPGTCPEHAHIAEKLNEIASDVKTMLKRQQEEAVTSATSEGRLVHLEAVVLGSKDCDNGTTRIDKIITTVKVMADRMVTLQRIVYGGVALVLLTVGGLVLSRVLGS